MLTDSRLTPAQVAMLTVFLITEYDRETGKKTTRARISPATLRRLADRKRLRSSFLEDWVDELSDLQWSVFPIGDNFAIIKSDSADNWVRIGSKRIRSTLIRISLGDEKALAEVADAVRSDVTTDEHDEE